MRRWSLGQLTVIGVRPWELVEIAARSGYDAVDPLVGLVDFPGLPVVPLREGDPDTIRMEQALKANGIAFNIADQFILNEYTDLSVMRGVVELTARMGAKAANVVFLDEDRGRGTATLAALADMTRSCGMSVLIEFMPISQIRTFQAGLDLIAEIGKPNIGLMVDALHLSHSGGGPGDMAAMGTAIFGAQLCDARADLSEEEYYRTAIEERIAPGEGELPLRELLAALPPEMICAIEVPRPTEPDLVARARRVLEAGKSIDRR